jgi:NADPH:quinone reductase-like Zn-dependent oxidoreductase
MAKTMRRWQMAALGRTNLALVTADVPDPKPGEVLVKVAAVALNYRDRLVIEDGMGLPLAFPFTPATDLAGTVMALGAGVTRFKEGDRVISIFAPTWMEGDPPRNALVPHPTLAGVYPGVLSENVAFPENWFVHAPSSLRDEEACTPPCAGLTAWTALVELGRIHAGQIVIVHGTGGVALFGLKIAKAHGAEVIVISGNQDKLARVKKMGADHGINRSTGDWIGAIHQITAARGADHILETVGGANLGRSLQALAAGGRISVIGVLEGFELSAPAGLVLLKQATIQGIAVGHRRALEDLVRAVDLINLKPVIDERYTLDRLPEALARLDRGAFGKIVITMA